MRKPINYLIVNMAMSDLLFPIFLIPKTVIEIHDDDWPIRGHLGEVLCKLAPFSADLSSAVSIQSLVLIAVDRFVAVVFSLRSPLFSSKLYRFFILATWIIAMATFIPYLVAFKLVEYDHEYKCVRQWMRVFDDSSSVTKYFMALFIAFFYIPFVLMFILYLAIFLKLKSQRGQGERSMNAQIQRLRRERNALKLSIAIVLGFAVCWIPFSIFALVRMFASENNATMSCGFKQLLEQVALLLSRTNSAMNPCICFIFSGNYRQGCWLKKNLISWYRKTSANVTAMVNGTQSMSSCFNPTAKRIGGTFAYCLLFVVSLAANTFIGIIVYRTKTMRTPINILIVNMALSDLLYPIFLFPKISVELNTAGHWLIGGPLGHAACKLSLFTGDVSTLVSTQSLLLIAVDRFGAVVFPLRSPLISSKQCRYFILVIWIIAMAVHCPYLIALKVVEYPEGLFCQWQWNDPFGESLSFESYFLGLIVVSCYVPLVLIAILYFAITLRIKSQKPPGKQSTNARERRLKKERNVLNMSVAIVLVFAVCWLPLSIYLLLSLYSSNIAMRSSCGMQYFKTISFLLAYLYCAVNSCICFIFSGSYRLCLKNLISCFSTGEAA
ncbi:unnamed protein product [Pocillopora meandrina]|uniref:G-protein coupled receptors family 1 profile domain-containing protein n=1 Tax=Pocillopora meandrina TaxID=46732 RepID=A0AAU9WUQ6_9CNID|nr:unnamed protein product [Pocillopora meandrina]